MINIIYNNKDLITIDIRLGQIRYLEDFKNHGYIHFIDIGYTSGECYESLFKEDIKLFYSSLKEDLLSYANKRITIKNCEVMQ